MRNFKKIPMSQVWMLSLIERGCQCLASLVDQASQGKTKRARRNCVSEWARTVATECIPETAALVGDWPIFGFSLSLFVCLTSPSSRMTYTYVFHCRKPERALLFLTARNVRTISCPNLYLIITVSIRTNRYAKFFPSSRPFIPAAVRSVHGRLLCQRQWWMNEWIPRCHPSWSVVLERRISLVFLLVPAVRLSLWF